MTEIEALKKELAEAKAEIQFLNLTLNNVMILLKKEMFESGKLPNVMITNGELTSRFTPGAWSR